MKLKPWALVAIVMAAADQTTTAIGIHRLSWGVERNPILLEFFHQVHFMAFPMWAAIEAVAFVIPVLIMRRTKYPHLAVIVQFAVVTVWVMIIAQNIMIISSVPNALA